MKKVRVKFVSVFAERLGKERVYELDENATVEDLVELVSKELEEVKSKGVVYVNYRFPKDVFLEDPKKYARLFKGIPLEVLRRATRERGLHVMDEPRVPDAYEQAVRDPDSVPVLPESPGSPGRPRTLRELVEARLPRVLTLGN